MALLTESKVRARADRLEKSAKSELTERVHRQDTTPKHDIFLSHSYEDRKIVIGVALTIEDLGYSVYIDWRDDPNLDRTAISIETAEMLRIRMMSCRCLLYSVTNNASDSKWMPWELGFKDGHNKLVAVLPVVQQATSSFKGQEYLDIYPYVDIAKGEAGRKRLWVNRNASCYISFDSWLKGKKPRKRD